MFDKPIEPTKDGLLAIINYTSGGANYGASTRTPSLTQAKSLCFNPQGDKFVVSDSKGNLIVYYLSANWYTCILKDGEPSTCIGFTGKDEVLLA